MDQNNIQMAIRQKNICDSLVFLKTGKCEEIDKIVKNNTHKFQMYDLAIKLNPTCFSAYIEKGILFRNLEQYDQAIEMFNKALQLNRLEKQSYLNIGNTYFELRDFDKAIYYYQTANSLDHQDSNSYLDQGEKQISVGKMQEAFQMFTRAIQDCPLSYEYSRLGNRFFNDQKYEEALVIYDIQVQLDPEKGNLGKVKTMIALGKMEQALQMFNETTRSSGYEYAQLGDQFFNNNKYKEALLMYNMSIKNLNSIWGRKCQLRKVKALIATGEKNYAFQIFKDVIQSDPHQNYCQLIEEQIFEGKNYQEALKLYDVLIQLNPKDGYLGKIQLLISLGQMTEGLQIFKRAIQNGPSAYKYEKVGNKFFEEKRYQEALIIYEMLTQLDKTMGCLGKVKTFVALSKIEEAFQMFNQTNREESLAYKYEEIGNRFLDQNNYKEALIIYEMLIQLNSRKGFLRKVKTLIELQKIDEAFQAFNEAFQSGPQQQDQSIYEYLRLGDDYFEKKNFQAALSIYDMLIQSNQKLVYNEKGKTLIALGRIQEAFQIFSERIQYGPSSYVYQKIGDQLYIDEKYQQALIMYEMLIQLDQKKGYLGKVKTLISLGLMEEAHKVFNESLQYDPNSNDYSIIGKHFFFERKYQEALIIYDLLIQLDPNNGGYEGKVQSLIALRQMEKASNIFNEAIQNEIFDKEQYGDTAKYYQSQIFISNLGFMFYLNNTDDDQIPNFFQLQYPWEIHKVFILQEQGIYELPERIFKSYQIECVGQQLVLFK